VGRHARLAVAGSSRRAQLHDREVWSALHGAADELEVGGPAGHSPRMAAGERVVRPKLAASTLSRGAATERSLARRYASQPPRAPDAHRGSPAFRERRDHQRHGLLEPLLHQLARQPQHPVAHATKVPVPPRVSRRAALVHFTVDLHHKLRPRRDEISDVAAQHHLPPEAHAELLSPERLPEQRLGGGGRRAEGDGPSDDDSVRCAHDDLPSPAPWLGFGVPWRRGRDALAGSSRCRRASSPIDLATTGSAAQQRHSSGRQPTSQRSQRSTYAELPHSPAGAIAPRTNRGELVRRAGATPRAPACGGIINDPTGRLVRVDHPDGSYEKTTQGTWKTQTWDRNDTLDDEENLWRQARETLPTTDPRRIAYDKASAHAATPSAQYLDPLGRPILSVAHHLDGAAAQYIATRTKLDLEGHPLSITDPLERLCQTHAYSIAGRLLRSDNIDAGARTHLATVLGEACRRWDARDQRFRPQYDDLRRPTHLFLKVGSASETLLERRYYGDAAGLTDPQDHHLRGKLIALYDGAGLLELGPYDFKGNLLATRRQLTTAYTSTPDWSPIASEDDLDTAKITVAAAIQTETFEELRTFDALNRVTSITTPDDSLLEPLYNEASLLEALSVYLRGATTATPIIKDLDYNAKGQRTRIQYAQTPGSGTAPFATEYQYDELTFRLKRLTTTRVSPSNTLQDLRYEFDPVGNIIRIQDDAQQSLFYDDAFVAPENLYTYDAVYRLIEATGREHASIGTTQLDHNDQPIRNLPLPTDPSAVRSYLETYTYDHIGNLLELFHSAGGGANTWTRTYAYVSGTNQLANNTIPGGSATYTHDAHGSITSMPHLASITYGPFDQMQSADLGGGGDAYYQYEASGQRVRKLIDTGANLIKERIYLGAYEIYREHISGDIDLERQSLHVMDGTRRVALLETLTIEDGDPVPTPTTHQRFQLGNHLDSALLEVDETGLIISYEEYAPYGTAAYRSTRSGVEVSARRYRYTGKERDEETGLYYHGARYYACWLGRWTSADPLGIGADGPGLYNYTRGSPVVYSDPSGTDSVDDEAATVAAHQQLAEQEYHRYLAEQYVQHEAAVEREQALASAVARGGAIESGIAAQLQALPEIELQRRFEYSLENQPPTDPEALGRGLLRGLVGFGSLEQLGRAILPVQTADDVLPFAAAMLPRLMGGGNPLAPEPGEMVVGVVKTGMVATNDEAPRGQQLEAQGELVGTGISALAAAVGMASTFRGKPRLQGIKAGNAAPGEPLQGGANVLRHYTDEAGFNAIQESQLLLPNRRGQVFATEKALNPSQAFEELFIGAPTHAGRGDYVFELVPRQGVTFVAGKPGELIYNGTVRFGRHVDVRFAGRNPYP
jgi:RHS repeat-associated protein